MCCEATDALLEYVRRNLGLQGLRGLNAPRRLKLRLPVLKEWLEKQGHRQLAESIPDWDPVRKPTGRWKGWEIVNLKPIMEEKLVERQAKRSLMNGDAGEANNMMSGHMQEKHEAALAGLASLATGSDGAPPLALCGPDAVNERALASGKENLTKLSQGPNLSTSTITLPTVPSDTTSSACTAVVSAVSSDAVDAGPAVPLVSSASSPPANPVPVVPAFIEIEPTDAQMAEAVVVKPISVASVESVAVAGGIGATSLACPLPPGPLPPSNLVAHALQHADYIGKLVSQLLPSASASCTEAHHECVEALKGLQAALRDPRMLSCSFAA